MSRSGRTWLTPSTHDRLTRELNLLSGSPRRRAPTPASSTTSRTRTPATRGSPGSRRS
ncbi:hypothetical protein ACFQXA_25205 [Nocardiopsis composta]